MNKFGVIAFCGSKGAGKSTSATSFRDLAPFETEELALAGHLKDVCAPIFKLDIDSFMDPARKEVELETYIVLSPENVEAVLKAFYVENVDYNTQVRPHVGRVITTPRKLLQYIGTEVLHPIDPLIHTKIALRNKNPHKLTIITDLRFVNEFEYLNTTLGDQFLPVYVRNVPAESAASVDAHPSERQLDLFKNKCQLIENDSSLTQLKVKLFDLMLQVNRES